MSRISLNTLRQEVGQALYEGTEIPVEIYKKEPDWFSEEKIKVRFDATPIMNTGRNPMQEILKNLGEIDQEQIFLLITPFIPAPIIELIGKKGYAHYCRKLEEEVFYTFFIQKHYGT